MVLADRERSARFRVAALVSGLGWHVQDLERAAAGLGFEFRALSFPKITGWMGMPNPAHGGLTAGGLDLADCDGVLVRMMPPGTLEQVVFRMDSLHRLQALGMPILNPPSAVEAAVDKYLALARMEAAGLPVPPTWAGESAADALDAYDRLGGDAILKPLFGSEGRGMIRVESRELAWRAFNTVERLGSVLYLQKMIPNPGFDLRVFVLGDRVLGAIQRKAPTGDWRANVAVGGKASVYAPDAEVERLALAAARAVGARMAGVDILPDRDGRLWVIEVNAVPGWKAFGAVMRVDVAAEILLELRAMAASRKESGS